MRRSKRRQRERVAKRLRNLSRENRKKKLTVLGNVLFQTARERGAAWGRTLTWLADELIDEQASAETYQRRTLTERLAALVGDRRPTKCKPWEHEWNLPGAGEHEIECALCDEKSAITKRTTTDGVLSDDARKCRRFRARFKIGLQEARTGEEQRDPDEDEETRP